jgi:hypothetical protein
MSGLDRRSARTLDTRDRSGYAFNGVALMPVIDTGRHVREVLKEVEVQR